MSYDDQLLRAYLAAAPGKKQRGSCLVNALFLLGVIGSLLFGLAIKGPELLVTYGIVPLETMCAWLNVDCPNNGTQPPAGATPQPTRTAPGGGGGGAPVVFGGAPLPDCNSVTDTTTACRNYGGEGEAPPVEAAPTGTPEPAYVTETCLTPPGARPCWLPPDQAWEEPASVPETPIVLLPEATSVPLVFSDSACAAWHPPLALPKGCEDE